MVRPIEWAPIHLSLEDVVGRAGLEVLAEDDQYISLIVGDPHGVLDQQLRPRTIHFLNTFIISILINYI